LLDFGRQGSYETRETAEAHVQAKSLIDIVLAAGSEIMAVYADMTMVAARKDDGSTVTEADRRAEALILAALREHHPSIPIVAEEEAAAGRIPSASESFFLVDPLDGTREFIERNGEFTVNVALVQSGVPVLGLVYAPALGDVYLADSGGAWSGRVKHGHAGNLHLIRTRPAPPSLSVVASRVNCGDDVHAWLDKLPIAGFLSRGSSLKFCLVASGEADLYPRFGRTMEWDTAAGDAILRRAGGMTLAGDGHPLVYGKRQRTAEADFANPPFVAMGDASRPLPPMPFR
jgi:3'(2'),5'-bisphosphate nucleotidase